MSHCKISTAAGFAAVTSLLVLASLGVVAETSRDEPSRDETTRRNTSQAEMC